MLDKLSMLPFIPFSVFVVFFVVFYGEIMDNVKSGLFWRVNSVHHLFCVVGELSEFYHGCRNTG